ncbi:DUF1491 family protein [Poseidonocella sp. HB161398]|uniref:DUF1491 family protein n=1 Tax=Poseidonocella sp. HB161398 TaxID=2320855 RepID=UPI0011090489|nr:DUF1491 family protein [Poseidonocella sp. HB161398]
MSRLATGVWVGAYMTRLGLENIPAYVVQKGDATAGAVWVKVARLDGTAELWERQYDLMADRRDWVRTMQEPEFEIDARIARETGRDRDLWVIELESRDGRCLLDDPSLA